MITPTTPKERLARIRTNFPTGTRLAEALALAVRAEPELLREIRLIVLPTSSGSLEADLYFSPLVAQRTPDWIQLDPELSLELQNGLTAKIEQDPRERERVSLVRQAIRKAHASAPFEIECEEKLIWLSVARSVGPGRIAEIDEILREVLGYMLLGASESTSMARWFASASKRMPAPVRETEAFCLVAFATSSILGGRKIEGAGAASLETFEELTRYLPQLAERNQIWAAMTTRGIHFTFVSSPGYQLFEVPQTNPVLLEVTAGSSAPRLVSIPWGQSAFLVLAADPITVRTLFAELLYFRPKLHSRGATAGGAGQVTRGSEAPVSVYVLFSIDDNRALSGPGEGFVTELVDFLSKDNRLSVRMDTRQVEPDRNWLRAPDLEALHNSDFVLLILSPSAVSTESLRREWRIALEGEYLGPHKATVVTVLYRDCEIPSELRGRRTFDVRSDRERGFRDLRDFLVERQGGVSSTLDRYDDFEDDVEGIQEFGRDETDVISETDDEYSAYPSVEESIRRVEPKITPLPPVAPKKVEESIRRVEPKITPLPPVAPKKSVRSGKGKLPPKPATKKAKRPPPRRKN